MGWCGYRPQEMRVMTSREKTSDTEKALQRRPAAGGMGPWDEMERWFGEFGRRGWLHPVSWEWPRQMEAMMPFESRMPKVDVLDRESEVVIRAELPGVEKDDLDVTVSDHTVTISARTKHEEKTEEKGVYFRHEMSRGEYQRTLELPHAVDEDKAKATFTDGVLELTLPKTEKAPYKTVQIE